MEHGTGDPDFTMSDLLQELREEFGVDERGTQDEEGLYTSGELAEFLGETVRVVRKRLRELKEEGRLDDTVRKRKMGLGNICISTPAYRLINKREDEK